MLANFYFLGQMYVICCLWSEILWATAMSACVIVAHAANHETFHGYFNSICIKQHSAKVIQELRIHFPADFYI